MGGGILPIAIHTGNIYLLFSRERLIYSKSRDKGLWSDFGGSKERNETTYQTALREGSEESNGILGDKKHITNLMEHHLVGIIGDQNYSIWVVEVQYNIDIIDTFEINFQNMVNTEPNLVTAHNGLYEKDKIKWIKLSSLTQYKKQFRPWYFERYVPQIIKLLNYKNDTN
jgi:8-oxo-dGTP pyrophosphatase MutT (NUDIX family)